MTVILTLQIAVDGQKRTCSATCHTAKKDECACICGSKFHGLSRGGQARPKNLEDAERLLEMQREKLREKMKTELSEAIGVSA